MALFVGEPHDLVFQGRAVAGADSLDPPRIEGRFRNVVAEKIMGGRSGVAEVGRETLFPQGRLAPRMPPTDEDDIVITGQFSYSPLTGNLSYVTVFCSTLRMQAVFVNDTRLLITIVNR